MRTLADYPKLLLELLLEQNGVIEPKDYSYGSNKKLFWRCDAASDHVWEASVKERAANGWGCPFCSGRRVSKSNSLSSLHPELATMWHPTKNGDVTPDDVTAGSHKKVWWQCAVASDHEWQATIASRASRGGGCPFCDGKRPSSTNCLSTMHPKIAAEWHPDKNGLLKPDALTCGSSKKVWWRFSRNSGH